MIGMHFKEQIRERITTKTALSVIVAVFLTAQAWAYDGSGFSVKRIVYEFDAPGEVQYKFKLKSAKVIFEYARPAHGIEPWVVTSVVVELGKQQLAVPSEIMHDISVSEPMLMSLDYYIDQYYLRFWVSLDSDGAEATFAWRDGRLTEFKFKGNNMNERYPGLFKRESKK